MNATTLYAQLSREVFLLNEDTNEEVFTEFMKIDKGFYKLRNLLQCRSCREICDIPYSSEFCQHLTCKNCFEAKQARNAGCKWCRITENLTYDINSKILVGLYRNLCAILRDFVTGSIKQTGRSPVKDKLLKFLLDERCAVTDVIVSENKKENKTEIRASENKETNLTQEDASINNTRNSSKGCPPCCCTCTKDDKGGAKEKDFSNDPIKVTAAQSSGISIENDLVSLSPAHLSDNVSSTVPDSAPAVNSNIPVQSIPKMHDQNQDGGSSTTTTQDGTVQNSNKILEKPLSFIDSDTEPPKISPSKFYKTLSSISLKERNNRNIFEKYGLALSPPEDGTESTSPVYPSKKAKKKKNFKGSVYKEQKRKTKIEPKVKPLKLKVKKVVTNTSDVTSYKVHYINSNENADDNTDDGESSHEQEVTINNNKVQDELITVSDSEPDHEQVIQRKVKRKATFISNYAIFSDESDFEPSYYQDMRKTKKTTVRKQDREVCGCGAGSHVKYFTDICKRSRCPCYSQGRACVNCKCRFCSNPYLLDDEVEEVYSGSESSQDQPLSNLYNKDEIDVVDVEA